MNRRTFLVGAAAAALPIPSDMQSSAFVCASAEAVPVASPTWVGLIPSIGTYGPPIWSKQICIVDA